MVSLLSPVSYANSPADLSPIERCVLVTFYFTQEMLPSVASSNNAASSQDVAEKIQLRDLVEFVDVYGSYLKLHLSLVHAAAVRADEVVNRLLDLSRHDPRHREVMKELSKTSLVLYEPVSARFLSCLCCPPRTRTG